MKDYEIEFITKIAELSESGNLTWTVENIGGHNRLFQAVFFSATSTGKYIVLLTTPTVASPRAQVVIQLLRDGEPEPMNLIDADTKTPLLTKEEIASLVRLKDSAIQYVKVIKENLKVQMIADGIKLLDAKKEQG